MTELDFDELDKAVNNLMTNVDTSKRPEGLDDPEDKVVTLDSSPVVASTGDPQSAVTPVAASTPSSSATLAVKRRGQFMDVIHPSSDMTSSARPVKRDGVSIAPTVPIVPDEVAPVEAPVDDTDAALTPNVVALDMESTGTATPVDSVTPAEPLSQENTPPSETSQAWPDPIDFAATLAPTSDAESTSLVEPKSESVADGEPSQPASDTELPEDVLKEVAAPPDPAPLTTPFLADAKVEKRPLGANSDLDAQSTSESPGEVESPAPSTDVVNLPDELKNDVVAAEPTDTTTPSSVTAEPTSTIPQSSESVVPAGGAITQQYAEQASTGDQSSGSIYDTATYHQAIDTATPAKKSSPLKWILWVVILLLTGAAAGVAYFYFTR
jgi:hypothetical protein